MISQQTIQQIQSRIDIIDIVGGFVKLKKRGANYLGQCPFHNEKTPSFTVSPAKEIYKCFGCGRSGNSISFLMEHEKYSYTEALRWLANKYNVEIEETESSPEVKQLQQLSESLFIINGFAQKYFTHQLVNSEEGLDIAFSYLKERGFGEEIIKKFQLGYCLQQRDAFAKAAIAAQYNPDILQKTGLVVLRDDTLVDNYRGRIVFPIHNITGKVIGFGARIIGKNDKAPKYINTPENELYVKSKILYGSYFARQAIDKTDECLLVEGYTDVISLHQAGIENVVASGGTSLTIDQLRLVKKYTNNLTIIYDGDSAGVKAAMRGLDMALEESLNVKLVLIPDKEDPDSYVNKVGAAAFTQFIKNNKKDFILFQLEAELKDAGNDSTKKSEVVNKIAETISKINKAEDFTKQQDYIRQCSQILSIDEKGLHSLVNKFIRSRVLSEEKKNATDKNKYFDTEVIPEPEITDWSNESFSLLHQDDLQEQAIGRVLLEHGFKHWDSEKKVADYIFEQNIDDDLFENKKILFLINDYKDKFYSGLQPTIIRYTQSQDNDIVSLVISLTNFPYTESAGWLSESRSEGINPKIFDLEYEKFLGHILKNGEINSEIYQRNEDEHYKELTETIIEYLKIRKIRKLILQNQIDFELPHSEYEIDHLIKVHNYLKEEKNKIGNRRGIVMYPF
ncbi:MAG: DNA primase [Chitinophagaceae bacterium]